MKKEAQLFILALMIMSVWSFLTKPNYQQPISPANYQRLIAQGFSTNWFKSSDPLSKYLKKNIEDVYNAGFKNLRLRCRADLHPPNDAAFDAFLNNLEQVVDDCLETGVVPVISWIHHDAEANATDADRRHYVTWWTKVAMRPKYKDYRLSYNLFTELGKIGCGPTGSNICPNSLGLNTDKYNQWTSEVVKAIRATHGNNANRIVILGSPKKTDDGLNYIDKTIYKNDHYMMAEWHLYASGPNKRSGSSKHWTGNGSTQDRQNVKDAINTATSFTTSSGLLTYLGAWMPQDNSSGDLDEDEVINFGQYFAKQLKWHNIPWSMNVLDVYYDTKKADWIRNVQNILGQPLNMSRVLDEIKTVM